jgi:hypothetical protein
MCVFIKNLPANSANSDKINLFQKAANLPQKEVETKTLPVSFSPNDSVKVTVTNQSVGAVPATGVFGSSHIMSTERSRELARELGDVRVTNCFPTYPGIFFDDNLDKSKNLVNSMISTSIYSRSNLLTSMSQFYTTIDKMNDSDLLKLARHIGDLMSKTDGNDDFLGALQNTVFDKISEHEYKPVYEQYNPYGPFTPPVIYYNNAHSPDVLSGINFETIKANLK